MSNIYICKLFVVIARITRATFYFMLFKMLQRACRFALCRDYYQYKKGLHNGDLFCIGDTNATNFELLLSPEYYLATMRLYEEIKRNNLISLQLSQTFDNDISLNEAKHYHSPPP